MHCEVLLRDGARDWHGIEDFHEEIVDFNIEPLQDLIAEGERFCHVS